MADIFFSYTHVDRERVRPVVELLQSEGWTVWWDRGIEPGEPWLRDLEAEIARCRAMVVAWSKTSAASQWVHREAAAGLEKGALVPVLLEAGALPSEFADVQATDLSTWDGRKQITEVEALLRRLASLVPPSRVDTVRPGYDPLFLDPKRALTLPGVTGPVAVLRYLHFTVVMNPARRIAHYVAYNCAGKELNPAVPRHDAWASDPLLPESLQLNMALLRQSPYDRGHLMSRMTGCWGDLRFASISARQAFYWPNIAPQHAKLNQNWWRALEEFERAQAVEHSRLTGFSGPVFAPDDEPFRGDIEFEHGLIAHDTFRVPRAYWKVCVVRGTRGRLRVAAFLMNQYEMVERNTPREIDIADYRITIPDLGRVAGLRFPAALHDAASL